ncbi:MAG: hypothetical protein Tsb009_17700 [Planctomycetaceae bacterium]
MGFSSPKTLPHRFNRYDSSSKWAGMTIVCNWTCVETNGEVALAVIPREIPGLNPPHPRIPYESKAAWAAAKRATGTRNGEQLT